MSFISRNFRFLLFGFALTFFSSFGQTYFIGVFSEDFQNAFDLSEGAFGLRYSIATIASGCCVIWLGRKIDDVDLRMYASLVGAGLVLACVLLGTAGSVLLLTVGFFVVRLSGQGLLSHTAITTMAHYFDAERGRAMAIAGLGFPAGEALLPILAVTLKTGLGWRGTWLLIAGVLVITLFPLIVLLLRGHAARHATHLARAASAVHDGASRQHQWTRRDVLGDPGFYLLLPAVLAPPFIVTGLFLHQGTLRHEEGWSIEWFAACFVAFAAAQLPASLLVGPIIDRAGAKRLFPFYLLPMMAALAAVVVADHQLVAPLFLVLTGVTAGVGGTIIGALWAERYGVLHLGAIRALASALMVFSTGASPFLMGWLIDRSITMRSIVLACLAFCVAATMLAFLTPAPDADRVSRRSSARP